MNIPGLRSEDKLNQWLGDNLTFLVFLVGSGFFYLFWQFYGHTLLGYHHGVNEFVEERIKTSDQQRDVKFWYSELSNIQRRRERAQLGEMAYTQQDEIDLGVYSRLMLETCQDLAVKGDQICERMEVSRVIQ